MRIGLRAARERRGLTQEELARRCGAVVDQTTISRLERLGGNPAWRTVLRLAAVLRVSPARLTFDKPGAPVGTAQRAKAAS